MNTMAIFGGEMEVPVARKWPKAIMGGKRERERERDITRRMRKKRTVHILVFGLNITGGFSVGNRLMK